MATGTEIMTRAGVMLLDEDHIRWQLSELAGWINDAVKAVLLAKPSANSKTISISLQAGTLQNVPAAGDPTPISLIRLVRNLLDDETPPTGGRAVTPTSIDVLNAAEPNWHSAASVPFSATVRQFVFTADDPMIFYVYPGNNGEGRVEGIVSALPTPLAATGDVDDISSYNTDIGLQAIYDGPLLDYVCYRAQSKDDAGTNVGRAAAHYRQFADAMGIKVQNDGTMNPARQSERK